MRFAVAAKYKEHTGWALELRQEDWHKQRELRLASNPESGVGYPLPPEIEVPAPGEPHYPLCTSDDGAEIEEQYQQIIERRAPQPGAMQAFGRYLFTTMLGEALWDEIVTRAGEDWIELALSFSADEPYLQRLPWEMMHAPEGFLASGAGKTPRLVIAVTRLIANRSIAPAQLRSEPRILFAIGSSLNDQQISPGAEYLGLVRALEAETPGGSRCLQSRILENASPASLSTMTQQFQPDVVHFICHGKANAMQSAYLELKRDKDDPKWDHEPFPCFAENLVTFLRGTTGELSLPQVVVLSACESGQAWATDKSASLAAELITKGIPIVVGMGGEVADSACRLFTRAFGTALLSGKPIVSASAAGRLAAFSDGHDPGQTVDWVFPQLHLSIQVPSDFALLPVELLEEEKALQRTISDYQLDFRNEPRLAARFDCIEAFYDLLAPESPEGVMALIGDFGYGKTRLLEEMVVIALQEGHLPITLINLPPNTVHEDLTSVLRAFYGAFLNARDAHGIQAIDNSQIQLLKNWDGNGMPSQDLLPSVREGLDFGEPEEGSKLTTLAVLQALKEDLQALLEKARGVADCNFSGTSMPILLLDDLSGYPKQFIAELFSKADTRKTTSRHGIGSDRDHRVPVVTSTPYAGHAHSLIKKNVDQRSKWVKIKTLAQFSEEGDEYLSVYGRVLLHPFNPDLLKKFSDIAWVRNHDVPEDKLEVWRSQINRFLKKTPSDFTSADFYYLVMVGASLGVLRKADDDEILRNSIH